MVRVESFVNTHLTRCGGQRLTLRPRRRRSVTCAHWHIGFDLLYLTCKYTLLRFRLALRISKRYLSWIPSVILHLMTTTYSFLSRALGSLFREGIVPASSGPCLWGALYFILISLRFFLECI